jgi:hypothetical protein
MTDMKVAHISSGRSTGSVLPAAPTEHERQIAVLRCLELVRANVDMPLAVGHLDVKLDGFDIDASSAAVHRSSVEDGFLQ